MGAVYSVTMKVKLTDEKAVISALNHKIANSTGVNYSLEKCESIGVNTITFDNLMKILLAEHQCRVDIEQDGDFTIYRNGFNASYGWEGVMIEWFEVMTPFLADGSELLIYPDYDYDKLVIENGECVWVH